MDPFKTMRCVPGKVISCIDTNMIFSKESVNGMSSFVGKNSVDVPDMSSTVIACIRRCYKDGKFTIKNDNPKTVINYFNIAKKLTSEVCIDVTLTKELYDELISPKYHFEGTFVTKPNSVLKENDLLLKDILLHNFHNVDHELGGLKFITNDMINMLFGDEENIPLEDIVRMYYLTLNDHALIEGKRSDKINKFPEVITEYFGDKDLGVSQELIHWYYSF